MNENESKNNNNNNTYELLNNKIDITIPVILVDTSYWLYYRFFALRNWYHRAFPEINKNINFNMEHNWMENTMFMTKYQKLFIENIKILCKKYNTKLTNVIFCIDCPYKEIWRCKYTENYKGTRLESHKKQNFNSYNIFNHIKKNILPNLQQKHNIKIIANSKCEADDIIGNLAPLLVEKGTNKVIILANDNDYLQICNSNIYLINGVGNIISDENICKYIGEKYLISKILIGDKSDNIKCCSVNSNFIDNLHDLNELHELNDTNINNVCNEKYKKIYKTNIDKIISSNFKYNILKNMLYEIRNNKNITMNNIIYNDKFKQNATLMDFQMLPIEIKNELNVKFLNLF